VGSAASFARVGERKITLNLPARLFGAAFPPTHSGVWANPLPCLGKWICFAEEDRLTRTPTKPEGRIAAAFIAPESRSQLKHSIR
jgi:hypothetical protein